MALLWVDGFEGYGTSTGSIPSPSGVLEDRYKTYNTTSPFYCQISSGRNSNYAIWLSTSWIETPALTTDDTIIVGFAFKITDLASYRLAKLSYGDNNYFDIIISGTELVLKRHTTILATTSGLNLVVGTWRWLEIKVKCHDTTGTYELKIDGSTVLSDTGVDTADSCSYYSKVRLGYTSSALDVVYDDFFICDSTGSTNNDFLGDSYIVAIYPDGDGNSSQFTPSAGDNYTCVDEEVIDYDTTYVESDTTGHLDLYTYESISAQDILGIQINMTCKETNAESFGIKTVTRIGSTDYTDSELTIGSTDYVNKRQIKETSPATSVAWTSSEITGAEFGVEVA